MGSACPYGNNTYHKRASLRWVFRWSAFDLLNHSNAKLCCPLWQVICIWESLPAKLLQKQILPPKVIITIHITAPAASLGPGNLWYHRAHKSVFYTGLRISSTGAAAFITSEWICFLFSAFLNNCKFFLETMPTLWLWGEAVSSRVGPEWATMERRLLSTLGRKTTGWFSQGGVFCQNQDIFILDFSSLCLGPGIQATRTSTKICSPSNALVDEL